MLKHGQIIRMGTALYRVDYVNECRARVVPLPKSAIGDRELDIERAAVNISPNSEVEVVVDIQRALDELELAVAEGELRRLRKEAVKVVPEARAPIARASERPATLGDSRRYMRWFVGPKPAPEFKEGSLGSAVMGYIVAHPGQTTAEIVEGVAVQGAVAACVSRFNQAGLIYKG